MNGTISKQSEAVRPSENVQCSKRFRAFFKSFWTVFGAFRSVSQRFLHLFGVVVVTLFSRSLSISWPTKFRKRLKKKEEYWKKIFCWYFNFARRVEITLGAIDMIFPFSENWPANYNFSLFSKLPTNYPRNQEKQSKMRGFPCVFGKKTLFCDYSLIFCLIYWLLFKNYI